MKRMLGVLACVAIVFSMQAKLVTIENNATKVSLDAGKCYSPVSLVCKATGVDLLSAQAVNGTRGVWCVSLRQLDGQLVDVTAATPCAAVDVKRGRTSVTVTWKGVKVPGDAGTLDFALTVGLRDNGDSVWMYNVQGSSTAQLWKVAYPVISGVRSLGEDYLAYPYFFGRLAKNPTQVVGDVLLNYPQPSAMQFCAYWGTPDKRVSVNMKDESGWQADMADATGFYYAAEDPRGAYKQMLVSSAQGHLTFSTSQFPPIKEWPPKAGVTFTFDETSAYPVIVQPYKGDVFTACSKYGAWAAGQPWCSAGRMAELDAEMDAGEPDAIVHWKSRYYREASFWTKFYEESYKVLPEWAALQSWLRVPSPSHYYRYNQSLFDDNYPEHLPGRPFLQSGIRAAKRMGVYPQPYNNGVIWDMDTQSWIKEHGEKAMRIESGGNNRIWNISNEYFAFMCPYTAQWQAKMRETNEKQVWEQDMSGVYLDCFAATSSSMCYNPEHGHSLHGGDYYTVGSRKLMYALRKHVRKADADAGFFAEEICEQYLDCMDGFLTLDYKRPGYLRRGEQVFPLFNYVYNPYTLDFGSDASIEHGVTDFHLQMGRLYVWGSTPLVSSGLAKAPVAGDPNSEFLKSMVQGYYRYGRALTFNADMVRMSRRPMGSNAPKSGIDVQATPLTLTYPSMNGIVKNWNGPAVLASAFRKGDVITLLMANVSDKAQTARITVDGAIFDGKAAKRARVLWPAVKDIAAVGEADIQLPADTTAVVTYWQDADAPMPQPPELLKQDWQLVRQTADGPYPAVDLPRSGYLYACDDAIVQNTLVEKATAQMLVYDDNGKLGPRRALIPEGVGASSHRQAVRRERDGQPFALLHEIPFKPINAAAVKVLCGDKDYLSCIVTPVSGQKAQIWQQNDGIIVAGNLGRKNVKVLGWASKMKSTLTAAGIDTAQPLVFGMAQLTMADAAEIETRSRAFGIDSSTLVKAYRAVVESPSEATIAALSKALMAWYPKCAPFPGMFAPKGAGYRLLAKVAALQAPFLPDAELPPAVLTADDWLSPAIAKAIHLSGAYGNACVMPLGNWKSPAKVSGIVDGSCTLTTTDYAYIERMVPVSGWFDVSNGGVYPAITWLQCNAPYELQTQPLPVSAVSGTTVTATVTLRNWSTLPLKVAVKGRIDKPGFKIENPSVIALAPRSYATAKITVNVSEVAAGGEYELAVTASHAADVDAVTFGSIVVNVLEKMRPMSGKGGIAPASQVPTLRGHQMYGVYMAAGEQLKMRIENRKVTIYNDGMTWQFLTLDGKSLRKGALKVGTACDMEYTAETAGMYILECQSGPGAASVSSSSHPVFEAAMLRMPMALFCSKITRYFYVKASAKTFKMSVEDGGDSEPAAIKIISPTGRVVLDRGGNWRNEVVTLDVRPDEAGKAWTVEFRPVQDVTLSIYDGAESWLARTKDSVLCGNE